MLLSYLKNPKTSDVIEMVGIPIVQILIRYQSHSQFLHLLWQSRHLMNMDIPSSADLNHFAIENILLLPHLKQMYNDFSRASCGFLSCLITRFNFSLAKSKTGYAKVGSTFLLTLDKQKVNIRDKRMVSPSNRYIYFSIVFFFYDTHCFFYCH